MTTPDLSQAVWRKSSRSSSEPNCVEVAWLKSSRSSNDGNCVEVARPTDSITAVRDSKNPTASALTFPTPAWSHFLHLAN